MKGKLAVAVSVLEDVSYSNNEERAGVYARAARITRQLIEQLYQQHTQPALWNINFPASAMLSSERPSIVVKPLDIAYMKPVFTKGKTLEGVPTFGLVDHHYQWKSPIQISFGVRRAILS